MRRSLVSTVSLVVVLAGSMAEARGRCPAGFSPLPRTKTCVQDDCIEVGGILDSELRCTCSEGKACTAPLTLTRGAKAWCKEACPQERLEACVREGQTCSSPTSQPTCQQDSDCPACAYCDGKQCARATALVATGAPEERRKGKPVGVDWNRSRVTFWAEKAWAARYLLMQGCRLAFVDLEDAEHLAERLADERVKALAYFGPCTGDALRKAPVEAGKKDIFGKTRPAAETRYLPTLGEMTASELQAATRKALEKKLATGFRRLGERRAAKKKAAEAAEALTQSGWLHFVLNGTCHGLDDSSLADTLLRQGGVYWGRKGSARPGLPLTRHERAE